MTLEAYVAEHLGRQVWRPATVAIARGALERCTAILGPGRRLVDVRRSDVEKLIVSLSAELAPGTVRTTFQHLRTMMRSAVADGVIVVDPTLRVRLPATPPRDLAIPSPALVEQLRSSAGPFATAVVLGAMVGLRAGEAQGLLVSDIDFMRRTVHVRRQLVSRPALALTLPKTASSSRSVPVPSAVLDVLAAHIAEHGPGPMGGLLLHRDGQPMHDNRFNHTWRSTQARAGVTPGAIRFHSLRHAFASSLISAGCSVKAVATAMGHSSPTVTLSTYASLWPGDEDRIRSAIDSAWTSAVSSPCPEGVAETP